MDPICHFANLDLRFCVVKGPLSNLEARINLMVIKLWDDSITFNLEVMMVLCPIEGFRVPASEGDCGWALLVFSRSLFRCCTNTIDGLEWPSTNTSASQIQL
jgi:hypothetical protein